MWMLLNVYHSTDCPNVFVLLVPSVSLKICSIRSYSGSVTCAYSGIESRFQLKLFKKWLRFTAFFGTGVCINVSILSWSYLTASFLYFLSQNITLSMRNTHLRRFNITFAFPKLDKNMFQVMLNKIWCLFDVISYYPAKCEFSHLILFLCIIFWNYTVAHSTSGNNLVGMKTCSPNIIANISHMLFHSTSIGDIPSHSQEV